jgi:ATP-binding protein involved in chromosome partitioning
MPITAEAAIEAAASVLEPTVRRPLTELRMVRDVSVEEGGAVRLAVDLLIPGDPGAEAIERDLGAALRAAGASSVAITWGFRPPRRTILGDDPAPDIANIVLVMSGKGGVGKSTVATNLALGLSRLGAKVGLLDADMYGPSIPTMLGVMGRPGSADGTRFLPLERFGVKLMSLGFLLEDSKQAVIWRGPMLQSALLQFLGQVDWGPLDYLVLDMPPGTGDIALTIAQKTRTTGAIVVTTPQEVALQDVYKSVAMAQKLGIPLLGVIENESFFICDGCNKRHEIFGNGGGQLIADFAAAPLIGQIPIDPAVRQWGDAGTPVVQAAPESEIARAFMVVATKLATQVAVHNVVAGKGVQGGLVIDRSGGTGKRNLPIARG